MSAENKKFEEAIADRFLQCLTCEKRLELKDAKKNKLRCKKCQREYAKVWPETTEQFYSMFKGQV